MSESLCGHNMFPAKVIGKEVCKKCGLEYDVTDDWSGPDHAERDCIQVLKKAFSDLEKAHNRSIVEWEVKIIVVGKKLV